MAGSSAAVATVSAQTGEGVAAAVATLGALAERPEFRAGLPRRRRDQGGAWAESRLVESVGRIGLAALAPRLAFPGAPFEPVSALIEDVRRTLHQNLKNIRNVTRFA
ncbi:MAG TPA: hypothetical protein VM422_15685 [Amaricoccus sp.]|nr:hypothetical protein [Amaricoccus sp.]